jgi:hypothetical protein
LAIDVSVQALLHPFFTHRIIAEICLWLSCTIPLGQLRRKVGCIYNRRSSCDAFRIHSRGCVAATFARDAHIYPSLDYYTDEAKFLQRVEEDAASFRPSGQLIYSYTRPSPAAKGKGKGNANTQTLEAGSEDVVEYEVYHVRSPFLSPYRLGDSLSFRPLGILQVSVNTTDGCSSSFSSTSKEGPTSKKKKQLGNSLSCKSPSNLSYQGLPN